MTDRLACGLQVTVPKLVDFSVRACTELSLREIRSRQESKNIC